MTDFFFVRYVRVRILIHAQQTSSKACSLENTTTTAAAAEVVVVAAQVVAATNAVAAVAAAAIHAAYAIKWQRCGYNIYARAPVRATTRQQRRRRLPCNNII